MDSMGNLSLTGTIGSYSRLTGHISSGNSLRGMLVGNASVSGNLAIGTVLETELNTFVIVDEDGNEVHAVLVDDEIAITATPNDVRKGVTAITNDGVIVGEKEIPVYVTLEGRRQIKSGARFEIPYLSSQSMYDFTKLQAIICEFNTTLTNSVAADKVVINENVYPVHSTESIGIVSKNAASAKIDIGITNNSDKSYVLKYFMYKEIE